MKTMLKAASVAALLAISSSASAWWGPGWGGPGGWGGNDWFGDGWGDFNMNMSGRSNAWGRGYNHYRPYYQGPYGYGAPYGYGHAPYGYGAPHGYGAAPHGYGMPPAPQAPAAEAK